MHGLLYRRVSTEQQAANYSIERQREDSLAFAVTAGDSEAEEFEDVWSGRDAAGRRGWQALQGRLAKPGVDYVWAAAVDRLGRDAVDAIQFIRSLKDLRVKLYIAGILQDLNDLNTKLLLMIQSVLAETETDKIRDRTMKGRQKSADAGNRKIPNVLGYEAVHVDGEKTYKVVEEEAALVRYIYRLFDSEDLSYKAIACRLNDEGYSTKLSGKTRIVRKGDEEGRVKRMSGIWQQTTVSNVLHHGEYVGMTPNWAGDQLVSSAKFPPILDLELWERVQRKIKKVAPERNRNGNRVAQHALSGVLRCEDCGAAYYFRGPQGANKRSYYFHKRDTASQKQCRNPLQYIRAEDLHVAMESLYLQTFTDDAEVDALMRRLQPKGEEELSKELGRAEKRLQSLLLKRQEIQAGYEDHIYSRTEAAKRIEAINSEMQEAESRKMKAVKRSAALRQEIEEALHEFTQDSLKAYLIADGAARRIIYRRTLHSLTSHDGTVRAEWVTGRVDAFPGRNAVERLHGLDFGTVAEAEHYITPAMSRSHIGER